MEKSASKINDMDKSASKINDMGKSASKISVSKKRKTRDEAIKRIKKKKKHHHHKKKVLIRNKDDFASEEEWAVYYIKLKFMDHKKYQNTHLKVRKFKLNKEAMQIA